jgi:hypothetical protein
MSVDDIIRGTDGETWIGTDQVHDISEVQFEVDIKFNALNICEEDWEQHHYMSKSGKGQIKKYKTTSMGFELMEDYFADPPVIRPAKIITKIPTPDRKQTERVLLKNVKFTKLSGGYAANRSEEEDLSFVFSGIEYLDRIS